MVPRGWTSPLNSTSGELQNSLLADTTLKIYQTTKMEDFNNFMMFALKSWKKNQEPAFYASSA